MTEEKKTAPTGERSGSTDGKRPYEKPAIAEEEAYETCAQLSCVFCAGVGSQSFKCKNGPIKKSN